MTKTVRIRVCKKKFVYPFRAIVNRMLDENMFVRWARRETIKIDFAARTEANQIRFCVCVRSTSLLVKVLSYYILVIISSVEFFADRVFLFLVSKGSDTIRLVGLFTVYQSCHKSFVTEVIVSKFIQFNCVTKFYSLIVSTVCDLWDDALQMWFKELGFFCQVNLASWPFGGHSPLLHLERYKFKYGYHKKNGLYFT